MYKSLLYSTLAISLKIGRWNLDCSGSYLLLTWSDEFTLLMQPSLNYIVILQTFTVQNTVLLVTPGEGIFISLSKTVHFSSQTMLLVCNPSSLNLNLNLRSVYGCWLLILLDNYKTEFLCYKWKHLRLFMLFILWYYCDLNYHFHCLNTVYVQLKSLTLLCSYLASFYYLRTCQRNNLIT